MIHFLACDSVDTIYMHLAKSLNIDILAMCIDYKMFISKIQIESWKDLSIHTRQNDSIFEDNDSRTMLIDISLLDVSDKSIKAISGSDIINNIGSDVYLYDSINHDLSKETQKLWKIASFQYIELKPDVEEICKQALRYAKSSEISIDPRIINELCSDYKNLRQVVDTIDVMNLSNNPMEYYSSIKKNQEQALYMMGFNLHRLDQDCEKWYNITNDENLQLALSLVYGKIEKQHHKSTLNFLDQITKLDSRIKSRAKIPPVLWWKLFLFKSKIRNYAI